MLLGSRNLCLISIFYPEGVRKHQDWVFKQCCVPLGNTHTDTFMMSNLLLPSLGTCLHAILGLSCKRKTCIREGIIGPELWSCEGEKSGGIHPVCLV